MAILSFKDNQVKIIVAAVCVQLCDHASIFWNIPDLFFFRLFFVNFSEIYTM